MCFTDNKGRRGHLKSHRKVELTLEFVDEFLNSLDNGLDGAQLILVNNCGESVWPRILGGAGQQTPKDGGMHLGSGKKGQGGVPPATVVEMTLGSSSSPLHFYDLSLVDGFNLLDSMKPVGVELGVEWLPVRWT
ncbi:Thaumatin-like protein [Glycine soja]